LDAKGQLIPGTAAGSLILMVKLFPFLVIQDSIFSLRFLSLFSTFLFHFFFAHLPARGATRQLIGGMSVAPAYHISSILAPHAAMVERMKPPAW
jgi:hypothetical protein